MDRTERSRDDPASAATRRNGGNLDQSELVGPSMAVSRSEAVRLALCALAVLLGAAVMAGWLLEIEPLKSIVPGFATMKFNTALGFILSGLGLAAAPYRPQGRA